MKKAIAFLLCLCLFAAVLPVCAESREAGGYTYDNSLILTVVTTSENPAEVLTPNFLIFPFLWHAPSGQTGICGI